MGDAFAKVGFYVDKVGSCSVPMGRRSCRHLVKKREQSAFWPVCVPSWRFHRKSSVAVRRYIEPSLIFRKARFSYFGQKMARKRTVASRSRKKQVSLYMWSGVGYRKSGKRKCERLIRLHELLVMSLCNGGPLRRTNLFRQFVVC